MFRIQRALLFGAILMGVLGSSVVLANGGFIQLTEIELPGVSSGMVEWADYDNDNDLDFLLTGRSNSGDLTQIWTNQGNSTFTQLAGTTMPALFGGYVDWGDYDNDGDSDFILMGYDSIIDNATVQIWTNNGNSTFSPLSASFPNLSASSADWGDYDNDGDLDLVLTGLDLTPSPNTPLTQIWRNNGNSTFTQLTGTTMPGLFSGVVTWGDYDNDNDLDFLITGIDIGSVGVTQIWTNNGNSTFTQLAGTSMPGLRASAVDWGDYDNDGDLDLLLTGNSNNNTVGVTQVWTNNGNSTFTQLAIPALPNLSHGTVDWGDYDNDNDLDFLVTGSLVFDNSARTTQIWTNNGNSTFSPLSGTTMPGVAFGDVAWGDYDNDMDLDFIIMGQIQTRSDITQIWTNTRNSSGVELLRNRSFEDDLSPVDTLADFWGIRNGTGERRLCDASVARTGTCAFEFRGSGATEDSILQQRADLTVTTLNAGDVLTLRGYARSTGAPNFRVRIIVNYADGTIQRVQARYNTANATYTELIDPVTNQPLSVTLTGSNVVQVRVLLWSRNSTGRAYFDDFSLLQTQAPTSALIPMP
ncbi:MAG: VCBS repeat-containing protein [Anaerolineae bacterium]|jgi:hypothetical protein|nr:VCBS repeat-containing protein [Anaerolineae bacterium]